MGRHIRKIFAKRITFEVFSKESGVGSIESYNLRLPHIFQFDDTVNKIERGRRQIVHLREEICNGCERSSECLIIKENIQ